MKVLVIGEYCTDEHIYGTIERLCPEAPIPIIEPTRTTKNSGMAGNTHANLKALGVKTDIICNKVDIIKRRYVDDKSGQMLLRVDINDFCPRMDSSVLSNINFGLYDAVVISDYNKGFLTKTDIKFILEHSTLSFIDTKKELGSWILSATYIKLNKYEAQNNIPKRYQETITKKLIVTLGDKGAEHNGAKYATEKVDIYNVSGAGDTFLAALVFDYLETKDICRAIKFANECAAEVVQKPGVVPVC
jgi:D-beta-D-heptose 7-phosphate kinase/D-beta-D-heptose 1-phosphate adenosyltransferase